MTRTFQKIKHTCHTRMFCSTVKAIMLLTDWLQGLWYLLTMR